MKDAFLGKDRIYIFLLVCRMYEEFENTVTRVIPAVACHVAEEEQTTQPTTLALATTAPTGDYA